MNIFIVFFILLLTPIAACSLTCNGRNVDYVKENANQMWTQTGYNNPGYEGYNWSFYGGEVWYTVTRKDSPGVVYSGYLEKRPWVNELILMGPRVVSGDLGPLKHK